MQVHIDTSKGKPGSPILCPVAYALTELGYNVMVCSRFVTFYTETKIEKVDLPSQIGEYIRGIDARLYVPNFILELDDAIMDDLNSRGFKKPLALRLSEQQS